MKTTRQLAHNAVVKVNYSINWLEGFTGLNRSILFLLLVVVSTLLAMTTIICSFFAPQRDISPAHKVYKAEVMSFNEVTEPIEIPGYSQVQTEEVYAGRYDNVEGATYDMMGLPKDSRTWLTGKEWKGEHISDPTQISRFKMWKALHMQEFISYAKHLADEEIKQYPELDKAVIVAQMILESNFGMSRLSVEGNNLFGHKCHSCNENYLVAHDDSPTDRFQMKKTKWHSVRAHSKLLMGKYRARIKGKPNREKWLKALCGCTTQKGSQKFVDKGGQVYATSCYSKKPNYVSKLRSIIKFYKLDKNV